MRYAESGTLRRARDATRWFAVALLPNLIWEVIQLPLYTVWGSASPGRLAYLVIHCSLGDGLIAVAAFFLTSAVLRDGHWPRRSPRTGSVIVTAFGFGYTIWSEYRNVHVAGNWAYSDLMPQVLGLGVSPLLQWLVCPGVMLLLYRRFDKHRSSSAGPDRTWRELTSLRAHIVHGSDDDPAVLVDDTSIQRRPSVESEAEIK